MEVLFEDDSILVVNKPGGIATQSKGVAAKDLESECRKYRKVKGEAPEIYVVHRLDQPVSGILVFAKTSEAAGKLSRGMQAEDFSKDYRAVVFKESQPEKFGKLTDYLVKDGKTNSSRVVSENTQGAKEASLEYELLEEDERTAVLKVHLLTGRHHQIRVQLSHAGFPILGDLKYGTEGSIAFSKEKEIPFVKLTAYHLEFKHPKTGKPMKFDI